MPIIDVTFASVTDGYTDFLVTIFPIIMISLFVWIISNQINNSKDISVIKVLLKEISSQRSELKKKLDEIANIESKVDKNEESIENLRREMQRRYGRRR